MHSSFWTTPKLEEIECILNWFVFDTVMPLWNNKAFQIMQSGDRDAVLGLLGTVSFFFFYRKLSYDMILPLLNQIQQPGEPNVCKHPLKWKHPLQRLYKSLLNDNVGPIYGRFLSFSHLYPYSQCHWHIQNFMGPRSATLGYVSSPLRLHGQGPYT